MKTLIPILIIFLSVSTELCLSASTCDPITKFFEKKDGAYDDLVSEVYSSVLGSADYTDIHILFEAIASGSPGNSTDEKFNRFQDAIKVMLDGYFDACFSSPEEQQSIKENAVHLVETFLRDLDEKANYTEMRNILGKLSCLRTFPNLTHSISRRSAESDSLLDKCAGSETIQELFSCVHIRDTLPCIFDVDEVKCDNDGAADQVFSPDCLGFSIDTTGSMSDEISDAQSIILKFVQSEQIRTFCYVMAPFNDYGYNTLANYVQNLEYWRVYDAQSLVDGSKTFEVFDYNDAKQNVYGVQTLIQNIDSLTAHGGYDCPEFGMISLLKSIELIQGVQYKQATLAGEHNIIVLTDASAKDDFLYPEVISNAKKANVKIHVFYSNTGGCDDGYGHYHDIAEATSGLEATSINIDSFTAFVNFVTQSSDLTSLPMSQQTLCSNFSISPFMTSFSALYKTSSTYVTVTDPAGVIHTFYTNGFSFVLHEERDPLTGTWIACVTSGQLEIELKTTGDLEMDIENVVQDNSTEGDLIPTQELPIACHNVTFVLKATAGILANISFNDPLYLNFVNENGVVVSQTEIILCHEGFLSNSMLPYDELLQNQLQGFDIYGNPFRSYLAKRLVEFKVSKWNVTLLENPIVNPGFKSLVRAFIMLSESVESTLLSNVNVYLPTGLTVEYMEEPAVIELLPGASTAEFHFYVEGSMSLIVDQYYTMSIEINGSCSANYLTSFDIFVKHDIELTVGSHTKNQIMFSWAKPEDIQGNEFYYELTFEFENNTKVIVSLGEEYTYSLQNLHPYQLVYVSIQATTDIPGESAVISSIPFRSAEAEPSEVQNIQGEVLSNSSVLLKWQEPSDKNGILLYYKVIISDNRTIITETPYCIIDDLEPYMLYEAVVTAVNSAGSGLKSSFQFYSEQDTPLAPPSNIQYTFPSSTSVNVSWDNVPLEDRRGFVILFNIVITEYGADVGGGERTISVPGNKRYSLITGLKEYSNISLILAAETIKGNGPTEIICCILIVTGVPSPPLECTATITSSDSVVFQWKEPVDTNGQILAYHLFHETHSYVSQILLSYNETNGTYLSKKYSNETFQLYHEHNFTIAAENDAGFGLHSTLITVVFPDESEPSEVQNIQGEVLSNSSVLLKWQEPSDKNGILLYYKVIISDNRTIITETPYCIIDDLEPYMLYEAVVTAVNSAGSGLKSSFQFYSEQDTPLAPPSNIQYTFPSSTSVNVSWDNVPLEDRRGFVILFNIVITEYGADVGGGERTISVPGNKRYSLITGLKEYSNISLILAAETIKGNGPTEIICCILIVTGVPSPPLECTATSTSSDLVVFQWKEPADTNGQILAYHLFHETHSYVSQILLSYNEINGTYLSEKYSNDIFQVYNEHNFTIAAENDAGFGLRSTVITVVFPDESGKSADSSAAVIAPAVVVSAVVILILAIINFV